MTKNDDTDGALEITPEWLINTTREAFLGNVPSDAEIEVTDDAISIRRLPIKEDKTNE